MCIKRFSKRHRTPQIYMTESSTCKRWFSSWESTGGATIFEYLQFFPRSRSQFCALLRIKIKQKYPTVLHERQLFHFSTLSYNLNPLTLSHPTLDLVWHYDFPVPLQCWMTSDTLLLRLFARSDVGAWPMLSSSSTDFRQQIAKTVCLLFLGRLCFDMNRWSALYLHGCACRKLSVVIKHVF
jgi:hypothetical protein